MDIARSTLKIFAANIFAAGSNFLGIIIFSRELGATSVGTYFLFVAILGMIAIPSDFGLRGAVEKRISEGEDQGSFLTAAIVAKIPPVIFVSLLILLFRGYLNDYFGVNLSFALVFALFIREFAQLSVFSLRGELRVGETAILKATRQIVWLGSSLVFVSRGFDVYGLVLGYVLGFAVVFIWGWYKVSTTFVRPTIEHARSLFEYGKYNIVSSIGGYFYSWMDVIIIGFFLTQAHVGAYEAAWRVTMVVMLFNQAIATTIFPQISRWDAEETKDRIEDLISLAVSPSLLLVIPAFFGTLILSEDILRILFGSEFTIAWLVLIVLMGEKILQAIHVVLGRSLQAIDRPDLAAWSTVVAVLVNLVLNIVLVWRFGIIGAAVATTASFTVNTILHWHFLASRIRVKLPYREIAWGIVSASGMFGVVYLADAFLFVNNVFRLVVIVTAGALSYSLFLVLHGPIRVKMQTQFQTIILDIKGNKSD